MGTHYDKGRVCIGEGYTGMETGTGIEMKGIGRENGEYKGKQAGKIKPYRYIHKFKDIVHGNANIYKAIHIHLYIYTHLQLSQLGKSSKRQHPTEGVNRKVHCP